MILWPSRYRAAGNRTGRTSIDRLLPGNNGQNEGDVGVLVDDVMSG